MLLFGLCDRKLTSISSGGADTTVSAITYLFYCIIRSPQHYRGLRDAIDSAFPDSEPLSHDKLTKLPLLDAYINEAMRVSRIGHRLF
jgi:cytochrome P450